MSKKFSVAEIASSIENNEASQSQKNDSKKKAWAPDNKLLDGMSEYKTKPKTYDIKEIEVAGDSNLENIADVNASDGAKDTLKGMELTYKNIESAKKRAGIKHLQIPPGEIQMRMTLFASDPDSKKSAEDLDNYLNEIITIYPEMVMTWLDGHGPNTDNDTVNKAVDGEKMVQQTFESIMDAESDQLIENNMTVDGDIEDGPNEDEYARDLAVNIKKDDIQEFNWNRDEIDKIKKFRKVELNIIEDVELKYNYIEDDDDDIDSMLPECIRHINDEPCALPASMYRATFTGLSYMELIDLTYSIEANDLDAERKKWTIVYNHLKNPSIGEWEEYAIYKDPTTKKNIKCDYNTNQNKVPKGAKITRISKFQDFLKKTSYVDLDYMLYKILCATTMDTEIVAVDCNNKKSGGTKCNKTYEWIYNPRDLLITEEIDEEVLDNMASVMAADSLAEIMKIFKSSEVNKQHVVELPSSKFGVVFGHISAYEYIEEIYSLLPKEIGNKKVDIVDALTSASLSVVKSIIITTEEDKHIRINNKTKIKSLIQTLNEVDWQTINELVTIMMQPYSMRYSIRGVVCPDCKSRSDIAIDDISNMLFIVAQNLANVQVGLKRT